jgi:hypothetical protein
MVNGYVTFMEQTPSRIHLLTCLLVTSLAVLSTPTGAEQPKPAPIPTAPPSTITPPPHFHDFLSSVEEIEAKCAWFRNSRQLRLRGTPGAFVAHIRGKEGIPFPKTEEVLLPSEADIAPTSPALPTLPPPPSPTPYQPPVTCRGSSTTRVQHDPPIDDSPSEKEVILFDYVFIPRHLIPSDSAEALGINADLLPYDSPISKDQLGVMESNYVRCLPYRVRFTTKAKYLDMGDNVFRNYDKDLKGRGELSRLMKLTLQNKPKR